jgi:hypothetical protein
MQLNSGRWWLGDDDVDAGEVLREIWTNYLEHERLGVRAAALADLQRLTDALEFDPALRDEWAHEFLRERDRHGDQLTIRNPLFTKVLFPFLESRYHSGEAEAARWLARLNQLLLQAPACWEAVGRPGIVALWREAHRRDPHDEESRKSLMLELASYVRYTLHELPAGVLFGQDGATREECGVLLDDLQELRALLRGSESEENAALLREAEFHYRAYRDYVTDKEGHSTYDGFLKNRGAA